MVGAITPFESDSIAIGSFHAMEKGILTVQSAGNDGSSGASTVSSLAPWLFSIAASSIDRKFISKVVLANGKTLIVSIFFYFFRLNSIWNVYNPTSYIYNLQ